MKRRNPHTANTGSKTRNSMQTAYNTSRALNLNNPSSVSIGLENETTFRKTGMTSAQFQLNDDDRRRTQTSFGVQHIANRQSELRSQRLHIDDQMQVLQSSLDAVHNTRRRRGGGGFITDLLHSSVDSSQRSKILSMTQEKFNKTFLSKDSQAPGTAHSGLGKSKDYYRKYIHDDNLQRLKHQNEFRKSRYVPQSLTEKKTFEEKFTHYMHQMDAQEIEEQKEIIKYQTNRKLEIQKIIGGRASLNEMTHKESEPELMLQPTSPIKQPDMNKTQDLPRISKYSKSVKNATFISGPSQMKRPTDDLISKKQYLAVKNVVPAMAPPPTKQRLEPIGEPTKNSAQPSVRKNTWAKGKAVFASRAFQSEPRCMESHNQQHSEDHPTNTHASPVAKNDAQKPKKASGKPDSESGGRKGHFQQSHQPKVTSPQKENLDKLLQENAKNLKSAITEEQFCIIAGEKYTKHILNVKLSKAKYKNFLAQKYGNVIAEKLQITLDFSGPVDFPAFCQDIQHLCGDRNLLLQLAFDILDSNNDDRISELDLFKLLYSFSRDHDSKKFIDVFLKDFTQITKTFNKNWAQKYHKILSDNHEDKLYVERLLAFRNLQAHDKNFDRKKEKVLWPIFECKKGQALISGIGKNRQGKPKFGYNREVFKNINSVQAINFMTPQQSLKDKNFLNPKNVDSESDMDSEDEWQNQDFFESSVFWNHEQKKQKNALIVKDNQNQKEQRKKLMAGNSIANNYHVLRSNRKFPNLKKVKPKLNQQYPGNYNLFLFYEKEDQSQNPLWEHYITNYMEETQREIQQNITFEQFKTIVWKRGLPSFIIDFLGYISGAPEEIKNIVKNTSQIIRRQTLREVSILTNKNFNVIVEEQALEDNPLSQEDGGSSDDDTRTELQFGVESPKMHKTANALAAYKASEEQNKVQLQKQIAEFQEHAPEQQFRNLQRAFKKLAGKFDDQTKKRKLSSYVLTEESIIKNFESLFGHHSECYAKILYLKLSNQKDQAKINFMRFQEVLMGLMDDSNKDNANRACFNILDFKGQGQLDIMFLIQIYNNTSRDTLFAQEILALIRVYKQKNILLQGGYRRQIVLNFATFNCLIPKSCMVDELQYACFGEYVPKKVTTGLVTAKLQAKIAQDMAITSPTGSPKKQGKLQQQQNEEDQQAHNFQLRGRADSRIQRNDETEEEMHYRMKLNHEAPQPLAIPVPEHSPFEVLSGLDKRLTKDIIQRGQSKNVEELTLADYMLTPQQYENLYKSVNMEDANLFLQKLR